MGFRTIAALALFASAPAAGAVATAQDKADAQCLAALSIALGVTEDKDATAALTAGTLYFLGRLDGRPASVALVDLLQAEAEALEGKDMEPLLTRCGEIIKSRGDAMKAAGEELERRGAARK